MLFVFVLPIVFQFDTKFPNPLKYVNEYLQLIVGNSFRHILFMTNLRNLKNRKLFSPFRTQLSRILIFVTYVTSLHKRPNYIEISPYCEFLRKKDLFELLARRYIVEIVGRKKKHASRISEMSVMSLYLNYELHILGN